MSLFSFDPASVFGFLLTLMRISLVLFVLPFFNSRSAPTPIKAALCLVLALALGPTIGFSGRELPPDIWSIALMLIGELTMGLTLSLLVGFLFAAVQTGGSIIGFQMGFAMVNVVDPMTGVQETATAHFLYMLTTLVFLHMGGHLLLLKAFAESFRLVPPGGLYLSPGLSIRVIELSSQIFVLAVRIAAPVMVAVFLVDLAIGLISRAAPQMHVLVFGFPLKITIGFIFLGLMFTLLTRHVAGFIADLNDMFLAAFLLGSTP